MRTIIPRLFDRLVYTLPREKGGFCECVALKCSFSSRYPDYSVRRDRFILGQKSSCSFRGSLLGNICGGVIGHAIVCDFSSMIQNLIRQEQSKF